jgi:hypothetical protein
MVSGGTVRLITRFWIVRFYRPQLGHIIKIIKNRCVFMLHSYHLKDFRKFAFWRRQFNKAIKVDDGCYCDSIVIESND